MKKYYPWIMVLIAMLTLCVSNGMSITGISVFDESLLNEFDWSRSTLKFRDMITFSLAGLLAPLAGIVIDRIGVKKVMVFGFAVLAAAYILYGQLQSLQSLYVVHVLLGVVLVCCGLNVAVILVSHWFVEKRGMAIGLTLMGTSLGGIIFPQLGTGLIHAEGWRSAYSFLAVFPAIMLLATILLVRNKPDNTNPGVEDKHTEALAITYSQAIKTPTFWALAIIAMTSFYTVLGAQAHLFLYMRDLGFDQQTATNSISALFTAALVGKFLFGFLADHIDQKKVLIANLLVMLSGAVMLAMMQANLLWGAVIAFGFGWGGLYTLLQITAINSFGLASAGKILGTITVLDALGGGLGIWLTGVFFDSAGGNYAIAFSVFVGLLVIALLASFRIKPVTV